MNINKNQQEEMSVTQPHIGKMLAAYLGGFSRSQAQLARQLKMADSTLSRITTKDSIDFNRLWNISLILNHNFIAEVGEKMPVPYTTAREKELHEQLAMQQKEIEKLKIELAVYREILSK